MSLTNEDEKQIQQNYRPIIAVHKWFARRPGTLFRGLILSEYGDRPLQEAFYSSNGLKGITIADPPISLTPFIDWCIVIQNSNR
ncbi:MAG: hypothetical protein ABSA06_02275 [Geobacteraceae bacterium]